MHQPVEKTTNRTQENRNKKQQTKTNLNLLLSAFESRERKLKILHPIFTCLFGFRGERNFHIFYHFLEGLAGQGKLDMYQLTTKRRYR